MASGDADLAGTLTLSAGSGSSPVVVYVHDASDGTRDALLARHLRELLPERGIGVLAFDRRGEGESTGNSEVPIETLAEDVRAWLDLLRRVPSVDSEQIGLFAHSQGGWIAPMAAQADGDVACLVAVAPSGSPPDVQMDYAVTNLLREAGYDGATTERVLRLRRLVNAAVVGSAPVEEARARLAEAAGEPWLELAYVGEPEGAAAEAWAKWVGLDIGPVLRSLEIPVLLVVGGYDRWVDVDETVAVWQEALGERLTVLRLPEAGHFPTRAGDPLDWAERGPFIREYEDTLTGWLSSHLRP